MPDKKIYSNLIKLSSDKIASRKYLNENKIIMLKYISSIYKDILANDRDDILFLVSEFVIKNSSDKYNLVTKRISQKLSLSEQEVLLNKIENKILYEYENSDKNNIDINKVNIATLKKFSYNLSVDILEYFGTNNIKKIDYMIKNNNEINENFINKILTSISRDKKTLDYLDFYLIVDFAFENNISNGKIHANKINQLDLNGKFNIELRSFILDKISSRTTSYTNLIDDNNFKEVTLESIDDLFNKIKSFNALFDISLHSVNYVIKKEVDKLKSEILLNKTTNPYLSALYNKIHLKIDKKLFFMTQVSNKITNDLIKEENKMSSNKLVKSM